MYELIFFAVIALSVGMFFWRRFGTLLNPPSLCAFSLGGSSAMAVFFDALAKNGHAIHAGFVGPTGATAIVFMVGLIAFVLPWITARPKPHSATIAADPHLTRTLLQLDFAVLAALIATWIWLGQVPVVDMMIGNSSINDHIANLQNLPAGVMMINLAGSTALSLYIASSSAYSRTSGSQTVIFAVSIVTILIASAWQGNRQSFAIVMFFIVARAFFKWTVTYGHATSVEKIWRVRIYVAIAAVAFIGMFTAINYIRLAAEGRFSGPTEIFLYYTWPVYNMVSITSMIGFNGTGNYLFVLTELLPARFGGKDLWGQMTQFLFEPTSPSGYFSYWYISFGLWGVAAGSFLLSVASRYAFEVSVKSEHHLRIYILMLWSCAMIAVYSHFITLAYFWIPLFSLIVINFLSRLSLEAGIQESHVQLKVDG